MPIVLAFLGGSVLCAGLIHEDLAAVVFWLEFLSLPPLAIVVALVVGLRLRKRVSEPLNRALAPMLGPHTGSIGSLRWNRVVDGRRYRARFYKYQLILQVDCQAALEIRAGLDNKLAQLVSQGWEKRSLPGGVVVFGRDPALLEAFLDQPAVPEAITTLIHQDGRSLRSLYLKKGELGWVTKYLPETELSEANGRRWMDAAELLVQAAERTAASP